MSVTETLALWEGRNSVPFPDVARAVGLDRNHIAYAVNKGIIEPLPQRGPSNAHMLRWDDVVLIVVAAAIATAAGIAVMTVIRSLRQSGAQVTPAGVTIPIGGLG
jgi:hypothetical protein